MSRSLGISQGDPGLQVLEAKTQVHDGRNPGAGQVLERYERPLGSARS